MAGEFSIQWAQFGAGVAAIGSLGVAAFGLTEAMGKALVVSLGANGRYFHYGLPYVGFGAVKAAIKPMLPALEIAYGANVIEILAQQYRAGRSQGKAPDTIRQGVRLGLPFMAPADGAKVIGAVWKMGDDRSLALATALQASTPTPPAPADAALGAVDPMQALAGRFATALDARIASAFALADERYEAQAKLLAGVVAVLLAVVFNYGLGAGPVDPSHKLSAWEQVWARAYFPWPLALAIGLIAVPLAPVAKDISSSLQNALTAFKSIPGGKA